MPGANRSPDDAAAEEDGEIIDFPRHGGATVPPESNLPLQLTSFVGRGRELAELEGLLADGTRLLTLTGTGGSGKTRLAQALASEVVERFEDGIWWVELASLSDPDLVPQAVASVLRVQETPGRSLTGVIAGDLQDLEILLILDNCEHVVQACAEVAAALLHECPGLRIVATSREALGVGGEVTWSVPPLPSPDLHSLPPVEELGDVESVRLFVERAKYRVPGFVLNEDEASSIAEICTRLDGIPLAIELAAARVGTLSVEQISSRLEHSLGLLSGRDRTVPERQRTLRGALDWSYELLDEEERKVFWRLSMFAGGFTLEASEAVCGGDGIEPEEVLELVTRLVEKSLVLVVQRSGEVRYRLLEPTRQYAAGKLEESGEVRQIQARHAEYYLVLTEDADPESSEQQVWLERLETEHDNLRAALRWSFSEYGDADLGIRLSAALWPFWYTHGYLSEGRRSLEAAISGSEVANTPAMAKTLNGAGYIALFQGEYGAAKRYFGRSLALYRRLGDKEGIASSLIYLGFVAVLSQRDLESIPALYEEAASLGPEVTDRRVAGNLLIFSALSAISQGDLERASELSEEGLVLFRELRDVQGIGHSLNNLGLNAIMLHDYDGASAYLRENIRVARQADYKLAIQYSLFGLGLVAAAWGHPDRASRLWGAVEAMTEAFGIKITPLARSTTNYEGYVATARSQLDKTAFDAAWSEGRAMTTEAALEYALTEDEAAPDSSEDASLFSEREAEVLKLVAEGFTNPQVAERLYLSPRTVGQHLRSVYRKLGVSSRAAAAKEAVERGLI